MLARFRPQLTYANVMATIAVFFAVGGGALAATTLIGSNGVIHGCVGKKGGLSVVKPGKHCARGSTAIAWNQRGRNGPKGDACLSSDPNCKGPQGAPCPSSDPNCKGPKGDTGQRGPSDVYEAVQNNSSVTANADVPLTLNLQDLPPGTYAIYAKASLGPVTNNAGRDTGQCTLTAGTDQDRGIDDWEAGEQSFKTIDTALTHTFASTGTVTLSCTVNTEKFEMGLGSPSDTRIVAVRVDSRTAESVPIG